MHKKAQAGVGTLIIFIAMMFVAAITASVLVETATSLQNQALKTGKKVEQSLSTLIESISLIGEDGSDGNVKYFEYEIRPMPGSDGIKFSEAFLDVGTHNMSINLQYRSGPCDNDSISGYWTNSSGEGYYTASYIQKGEKYVDGYLSRGDIAKICFETYNEVGEDQDLDIKFVPSTGMPSTISVVTDSVMTTTKVRLYP
jgi:flagellin-like protein